MIGLQNSHKLKQEQKASKRLQRSMKKTSGPTDKANIASGRPAARSPYLQRAEFDPSVDNMLFTWLLERLRVVAIKIGEINRISAVMRRISYATFHLACYGCVLHCSIGFLRASLHCYEKCQYTLNRLPRLQEVRFDLQYLRYIQREGKKGQKVKGLLPLVPGLPPHFLSNLFLSHPCYDAQFFPPLLYRLHSPFACKTLKKGEKNSRLKVTHPILRVS